LQGQYCQKIALVSYNERTNVANLESKCILEKFAKLKPISFMQHGQKYHGFNVDEYKKIFPDDVNNDSIDATAAFVYIVKMVQDQQSTIDSLLGRINTLEQKHKKDKSAGKKKRIVINNINCKYHTYFFIDSIKN